MEDEESRDTASRDLPPELLRPIPGGGSIRHAAEHQVRSSVTGAQPHQALKSCPIACSLILKGLDLGLPRRKVSAVIGWTMLQVASYLRSSNCVCKLEIPTSAAWFMTLVRSMLCTRPVSGLDKTTQDRIASLLLQVCLPKYYLQVFPLFHVTYTSLSCDIHLSLM